jgi:hypothetical protein
MEYKEIYQQTPDETKLNFCLSPLNNWTKFDKQIRTINLGSYESKTQIYTREKA